MGVRVHLETVPRTPKKTLVELPANNTVKLSEPLRLRVLRAMQAEGFTVWSEFCRVALTEKCRTVESELRLRDPEEWERIFGQRAIPIRISEEV